MPDPKKKIKGTKKKLMEYKEVKRKPSSTDSVATKMYQMDKRTSFADIAKAAEKKHGKIDVSKFDITKAGPINVAKSNQEHGIKMRGKTPIMKQILANQEGLQKMTKTEKGREAVKNMGYTEDVDGKTLMKKDYASRMGGYGKSPVKLDTGTGKKKNPNRSDVKNVKEGINVNSPKIRKMYDKYTASGGKLSINQAARIGFVSPSESRRRMKQANYEGGRGKDGLKDI